jgi:hypothetical protein
MTGAAVSDQIDWNPLDWDINGNQIADGNRFLGGDFPDLYPHYDLVEDGSGGAILVFVREKPGGNDDDPAIYAQRVNSEGALQWETSGAPVCTTDTKHLTPRVVPCAAGGAIVVWVSDEDWPLQETIRAQKLNSSGAPQWVLSGVELRSTEVHGAPQVASDGSSGAIVAWIEGEEDFAPWDPQETSDTLRVQYVADDGSVPWGEEGTRIAPEHESDYRISSFDMVSDGAGGALLAWTDSEYEMTALRINSGGVVWKKEVVEFPWPLTDVCLCPDGAGGAYLGWAEQRNSLYYDIYAQKLDSSGNAVWGGGWPVPVCLASGDQIEPDITQDGSGGAILAWVDERVYGDRDMFAGRVDASGIAQWTTYGVKLCSAEGLQEKRFADIVPDGLGGAIVTWEDWRRGYEPDIYAQRIDSSGQYLYFADGLEICTAASFQLYPAVVPDGSGGAIIAWSDVREGAEKVYAQRMTNAGTLDGGWRNLGRGNALLQNYPNPFSTGTKIGFTTKVYGDVRLQVFDAAGRLVKTIMDGPAKPPVHMEEWDGRDERGRRVPPGTYFYRLEGQGWSSTKKMMVAR